MEQLLQLTEDISGIVWGWPMIILLLGTHLFLTFRLKFPQRKIWTAIKLSVQKDQKAKGDVSQFGALATSLAATIGTGNIIGVATAVSLGGPGAVLWCWLTGVFGIATKYSEGLLAIKYRVSTQDGRMLGGPMYALEQGLGMKWLGILFCVFAAVASFGIGNTVQANAISENLSIVMDGWMMPDHIKMITGFVLAALVGFVVIGGVKSIAKWCTMLVPMMALLYVLGCLYILCVNHAFLGTALSLIFHEAFSLKAVGGGTAGTVLMMAARYGIARGLFSNESGMGSAPIVAAAAQTKNPVRQALVSSTGTFWDTVVICAITGLVIVSSIIAYPEISQEDGGMLTKKAFGMIPYVGTPILTFGIITFAFSTILGWSYYGERAMEYLAGRRSIVFYRILYILLVYAGSTMSLALVWNMADIMNALMALPNLIALLMLSGVIAKDTQHYLWEKNLDEESEEVKSEE
ncbi:MAG: alanine:cation symporter family protein [Bacteroidaceae bacterium]|nr:alanine:cation symporter family protein [Bacteroidaceae bacterium]